MKFVLGWGARTTGICAYLAAQLIDGRWNGGRNIQEMVKDQDTSLEREGVVD